MPKQRQTCTRCSMRRQKCDRQSPCSRCVQNNEGHLCTTEWPNGYNPAVHRKYPRKIPSRSARTSIGSILDTSGTSSWSSTPFRSASSPRDLAYSRVPSVSEERATNVDFVSSRQSSYTDITVGGLLGKRDGSERIQASMDGSVTQNSSTPVQDGTASNGFSPHSQLGEVHHLQATLPSKQLVIRMTDYHNQCMAYWVGAVYHGPSFRKSIQEAYGESQELDLRKQDWRWSALLFSILSSSMIASDEAVSTSWGYSYADKLRLSREWGHAMMSCLNLGDYASDHHVYSVQAILNLHTSAHLVGSAKEWIAYQAAAAVIARGLGFHKLGPHPEDSIPTSSMTPQQKESFLNREIGRRIWSALTAQDWLCSTSQGIYHFQKRHYTSILPHHFDEETLLPIPNDETPAPTLIANLVNDVAFMFTRYLDDLLDAPDVSAKYNVVLRYDGVARAIAAERTPKFLRLDTPYDAIWPPWVQWARRSYHASTAHKIIMVHQSFLGKSFKDPKYTYSRWACLSSSKTIIETMEKRYPEEPQWWVEQAYIVTAGLCLGLNLFYYNSPSSTPSEAKDDRAWVEKAIKILQHWPTSTVATHGIKLLNSLIQEHARRLEGAGQETDKIPEFPPNIAPQAIAEASSSLRGGDHAAAVQQQQQSSSSATAPLTTPAAAPIPGPLIQNRKPSMDHTAATVSTEDPWINGSSAEFDVDMLTFDNLFENIPMEGGLDNNLFFESMLGWNSAGFNV